MEKVIINDVDFEVEEFEQRKSEDTQRMETAFIFSVVGKSNYNLYKGFFSEGKYQVTIPRLEQRFEATLSSNVTSYTDMLDEETKVTFSLTLSEINEGDEEELQNVFINIAQESIMQILRFRALMEVLEAKGIITSNEYDSKITEVNDRDFETVRNELVKGYSVVEE
ncbi:hypothetical protein [Sporosarcina sp. P1]|uniref:hypothetical protein n=1 Tax=Sporosarcina sp. P1 TaxID=2048257 RepID=UPI000C169053|nr:hypothetical protein [Sporosarcina sp. P1]PIC82091.1 hypothetical protein CSV73_14285 [Sporosarcina sp. P1]